MGLKKNIRKLFGKGGHEKAVVRGPVESSLPLPSLPPPSLPQSSLQPSAPGSSAGEHVELPDIHQAPGQESDNGLLRGVKPGSDNLGTSVLYEPKDAVLDVVFIHGLTGNAFDTWFEKKSEKHWPTDFVTQDLPRARTIAFGYRADVASFWGPASQARLSTHASDLVGYLVGLREETDSEDRQIVFVAHSLGGLVVERALQISESNAELHLRQIERHVYGILFMGTPHTGSGLAPFAESLARALKHLRSRANPQLLETLKRDSQVAADLDDWFYQWLRRRKEHPLHDIHITCFWEQFELAVVGPVVTEDSAVIKGYPHYSIAANHMDMTKFGSSDDPGYRAVRRELRRWIKPFLNSQPVQNDVQLSGDLQECLWSLDFDGLDSWQDKTQGPLDGTFRWILPEDGQASQLRLSARNSSDIPPRDTQTNAGVDFLRWLFRGKGIFWINGGPGTGKSTMMKHLADSQHVRKAVRDAHPHVEIITTVFFFYRTHSNNLARSKEGLIRSLLYQILERKPDLRDLIDDIWGKIKDRSFGRRLELEQELRISSPSREGIPSQWTTINLTQALKRIISLSTGVRFLFFVDGLDEYEGKDVNLAEFFVELAETAGSNLLMCLASRGHPDFKVAFRECPQLQMEMETADDLDLYVNERLRYVLSDRGEDYRILPGMVKANCKSVFLRAREVCDLVVSQWKLHASLEALKEEIRVGSSLDEEHCSARLCQRILNELDLRVADEAILMLLLVLRAVGKPLSTLDLAIIVDNLKDHPTLFRALVESFTKDDSESAPSRISVDDNSERSHSSFTTPSTLSPDLDGVAQAFEESPWVTLRDDTSKLQERIEAICGGLLTIKEDSTVTPLYDSLHYHLEHSLITLGGGPLNSLYHGDQQLLKASLHSLFVIDSMGVELDVWEDVIGLPVLEYAFKNSHYHWSVAENKLRDSQFKLFREVIGDIFEFEPDAWQWFATKGFQSNISLREFPPRNFLEFAALLGLPYSFKDIVQWYNFGNPESVPLTPKSKPNVKRYDVNSDQGRLLYCAARGGNGEILDVVLALGASINPELLYANAALGCCIYFGHFDMARRLLLAGADINGLFMLPEFGKHYIARYHNPDLGHYTPLVAAVRSANPEKAVKFVLANKANPIPGLPSVSPMADALHIENPDKARKTVRALLQSHRASSNLLTNGSYPLWIASSRYRGAIPMIRLLLRHRADPNVKQDGSTLLEKTLRRDRDKRHCRNLISLLLENEASVSERALAEARRRGDTSILNMVQKARGKQMERGNESPLLKPYHDAAESSSMTSFSEVVDSDR